MFLTITLQLIFIPSLLHEKCLLERYYDVIGYSCVLLFLPLEQMIKIPIAKHSVSR